MFKVECLRLSFKYKYPYLLLLFFYMASCNTSTEMSNNRVEILGVDFTNDEIIKVDIFEISHPMLGGVRNSYNFSSVEKVQFLNNFDKLKPVGMLKCADKYVIRLFRKSDTLRLKICGNNISNRMSDNYYQLEKQPSFMQKIIQTLKSKAGYIKKANPNTHSKHAYKAAPYFLSLNK